MAVPSTHGVRPELADRILAEVREDDIVSMGCDVVNIPSATEHHSTVSRWGGVPMTRAWVASMARTIS
ncbi:MAG TPA: hypothetical protein VES66_01170 [Terriglobales bacterium]|nr:hypothetical protein [Terriglobales bacterium]